MYSFEDYKRGMVKGLDYVPKWTHTKWKMWEETFMNWDQSLQWQNRKHCLDHCVTLSKYCGSCGDYCQKVTVSAWVLFFFFYSQSQWSENVVYKIVQRLLGHLLKGLSPSLTSCESPEFVVDLRGSYRIEKYIFSYPLVTVRQRGS